MSTWSASPSLEGLQRELDEQVRVIEGVKRLIEERPGPFQRNLREQRRHVDQSLKLMEARVKPLRQYLEGQEQILERVGMHLITELKDQFGAIGKFLVDQRLILERANRYLEDQQRAIEHIFRDLEERLEPFARYLKEEQKLLEAMADPRFTQEFDILASFCGGRQAALEHDATPTEYRPQAFFA